MSGAARRIALVLGAYAVGALLLLPVLDTVQRVLLLPELFGRLARAGLLVGVPLAAVVAWRYPEIGRRD